VGRLVPIRPPKDVNNVREGVVTAEVVREDHIRYADHPRSAASGISGAFGCCAPTTFLARSQWMWEPPLTSYVTPVM
jgi:hypothetical protein